jgi:hypothetical protein
MEATRFHPEGPSPSSATKYQSVDGFIEEALGDVSDFLGALATEASPGPRS